MIDSNLGVYSGVTGELNKHFPFVLTKPLELQVYAPRYKKSYVREVAGVPLSLCDPVERGHQSPSAQSWRYI